MNLGELKSAIAAKAEMTQAATDQAVKALMEVVSEVLREGGTVNLTGFGSFAVSERAARTGRNPQTGEPIQIAASKSVRFKAGKTLRDAINVKPKAKASPKAGAKTASPKAKKKAV